MAIYPPGPLKFVWQYLSSTLTNFKIKLLGYRTYKALLTQNGIGIDPTAIVLENTIDPLLNWTASGGGEYFVNTQNPSFNNTSKIAISIGPTAVLGGIVNAAGFICNYEIITANQLAIYITDLTLFPSDNVLINTEFNIKVYL